MPPPTATVLAATLLALATAVQAGSPPADTEALTRQLAARFDGDRSGACVLAAVIDGPRQLQARVCAGTRADPPPAMDAAFEIGSVSKTMTAFLVADLLERGAWSLDDPIARHLPEGTAVPRQGDRQILVRDLVTHSAGLPALPPGVALPNRADPYAAMTEAQLLEALGRTPLQGRIGAQARYSNFGVMLLSLAVARSTGGHLDLALRERLFQPLGMQAAVGSAAGVPQAAGHVPGGRRTAPWTITPNLAGVGMVRASLADMTRYVSAALGDGPAPVVAALQRTQQPLAHGFCMNWVCITRGGQALRMHDGATGGFSSFVALDPDRRRGVVLLADTTLVDQGGLADLGLALLGLDQPVPPPRRPVSASAQRLQALAGDYQLGPLTLRLWGDGERLMAQASGQPPFELRADSWGDFYVEGLSAVLSPLPEADAEAPIQRLLWRQDGSVTEGRRVGAGAERPVIAKPAWRDSAGD